MIFSRGDVDFSGDLRAYSKFAENGNITIRHFCATCGSQIFGSGPPEDDRLDDLRRHAGRHLTV